MKNIHVILIDVLNKPGPGLTNADWLIVGAVSGGAADRDHPERPNCPGRPLHVRGGGDRPKNLLRRLHHDEPRIRWEDRAP